MIKSYTRRNRKIITVFQNFWHQERIEAIEQLCTEENLKIEVVNQIIADYHFSKKQPSI